MAPRRSQRNISKKTSDLALDMLQATNTKQTVTTAAGSASTPRTADAPDHAGESPDKSASAQCATPDPGSPLKKRAKKRVKSEPVSTQAETADTAVSLANGKRRGKRGILQKMNDTPLDVLFEIFSYLEPFDLLRMSRTTKDLRQLLISKSSAFVWEQARAGVEGLPPKFDALNEIQFANLLFDNHCHSCGAANVKYVQWEIRMRLCKNCLESGDPMAPNLWERFSYNDAPHREDLRAFVPRYNSVSKAGRYRNRVVIYYHIPSFEAFLEESKSLAAGSAYTTWRDTNNKTYKSLLQECKPFVKWESDRKVGRTAELSGLRQERFQSILVKLRQDGWTEELKSQETLQMIRDHKSVNQPKALTEKMWSNMYDSLTEAMSKMREYLNAEKERTAVQRRTDLLKRLCTPILEALPEILVNPLALHIPCYEPFVSIITTALLDDVTEKHFADGLATLQNTISLWREDIETHLKMLLVAAGHSDDLALAQNLFTCGGCNSKTLLYPELTRHSCFVQQTDGLHGRVKATDQEGRDKMRRIIELAGIDHATATADDLDAEDPMFCCGECYDSQYTYQNISRNKVVDAMSWRHAMKHFTLKTHHDASLMRLTDPAHLAIAQATRRSVVEVRMNLNWKYSPQPFACRHCAVVAKTAASRHEHLRTKHGIEGDLYDHYRFPLEMHGNINSGYECDGMPGIPMYDLYPQLKTRPVYVSGQSGEATTGSTEAEDVTPEEPVEIYSLKTFFMANRTSVIADGCAAAATSSSTPVFRRALES